MSDTLVVAVSQSGTTTDTNRTVDIVRNRGAKVIAIVNRRGAISPIAPTVCCTPPTARCGDVGRLNEGVLLADRSGALAVDRHHDELLGDEMADDRAAC